MNNKWKLEAAIYYGAMLITSLLYAEGLCRLFWMLKNMQ